MNAIRLALLAFFGFSRRGVQSLRGNSPLMLLSLGLATVLWAFVTHTENPNNERSLPVSLVSYDAIGVPDGVIVSAKSPETVNVNLIGPQNAINSIQLKDIDLRIDLTGIKLGVDASGTYDAPITARVLSQRGNVRAEVDQHEVKVTLEPIASTTVPVKYKLSEALPPGLELDGEPVLDPQTVTLRGLKKDLTAVAAVFADIKQTSISTSLTESLPLTLENNDGKPLQLPDVQIQPASATVKIAIARKQFQFELPVSVQYRGRAADGYVPTGVTTDTQTVQVLGSLDALNSLTSIRTDDVEIDGATQDVVQPVALRLPPGVSANTTRVKATVTIQAITAVGSQAVAPRIVGGSPAIQVKPLTTFVRVAYTGPGPRLAVMKQGDVIVTVDVSGKQPSDQPQSIEATVTLPPGVTKDPGQSFKVDVLITAASPTTVPSPAATASFVPTPTPAH